MPFVVYKRTSDSQVDAAAGVDVDEPITGHHALARQAELWMPCLIAKATLDRAHSLLN
jgi:hypothetical protein